MPRNQLSPTHLYTVLLKHMHITKVSKCTMKTSQSDNNSGALAVGEAKPKTAYSRQTITLPDVALPALQTHRLKQVEE